MIKIIHAQSQDDLEKIKGLFIEYQKFLNVDLAFQKFEEELKNIPGPYASPDGCLLFGLVDTSVVGCVALKKIGDGICEMKRLFVHSSYRGKGYGKLFAKKIIKEARLMGYNKMRLDTLDSLKQAMGLYQSLGFKKIDAYYDNPLPNVVYWELDLLKTG